MEDAATWWLLQPWQSQPHFLYKVSEVGLCVLTLCSSPLLKQVLFPQLRPLGSVCGENCVEKDPEATPKGESAVIN